MQNGKKAAMVGAQSQINEGLDEVGETRPKPRPTILKETLHEMKYSLLRDANSKVNDDGISLPRLDLTTAEFQRHLAKEQFPLDAKIEALGKVHDEEISSLKGNDSRGIFRGLRSAYKIKHDGQTKYVCLMGCGMGTKTPSENGQSPMIKVLGKPDVVVSTPVPASQEVTKPGKILHLTPALVVAMGGRRTKRTNGATQKM
jgi:hypothetical protein